jgi:pilus assembly protein Flp/PilA
MLERLKAIWNDEEGPTAVEYALMVALIAVLIIATVTALKDRINATFTTVAGSMP